MTAADISAIPAAIPVVDPSKQQQSTLTPISMSNIAITPDLLADLFARSLGAQPQDRQQAQQQLDALIAQQPAAALLALAQLMHADRPPESAHLRTAAGLFLKNQLTAREFQRRQELQERWVAGVDGQVRAQVKQLALGTLASVDTKAGTTAAQVIAAIAAAELPRQQWPELVQQLLQFMADPASTAQLKQATLQTIGFVCEELPPELLESSANVILTAVIQGARKEEPVVAVRLAATQALINCLEFIKGNFEREGERNFIMEVVCEGTRGGDLQLAAAAFECLAKIMSLYYDKMGVYMQQALYALTIAGMRNEEEKIALQAIEFWSTVCDEEIMLEEEAQEALEYGEQPAALSQHFAKAALGEIVPSLLWLLTQQEEDADEDDWNKSMAAGTCLSLLAQCVHDDIVAPVVPFIEQNVRHADWRMREAAVMAFGSILDGPSSEILQPLVTQALPVIIDMTQDPYVQVKDTVAWTLGRISDLHPACIHPETNLPNLVAALLRGLEDSPRVASNCAWALMNLSESFGYEDNQSPTYQLSMFFEHIVGALLRAAERPDGNESNLRTSVYVALSSLLLKCPMDCVPVVQKTSLVIMDRLEASIQMESQLLSTDEKVQHSELQTALCGATQSFARRLGREVAPLADRIMTAFFKVFTSSTKTATTVEDVFLAIGVLINILDGDFARYMDSFVPFLYAALQNHEEHQLCSIAVGTVGDICRALGENVFPYCDQFVTLLLQNLQSNVLHRDVKPPILSAFGDIALAIQFKFEKYLQVVMMVLQQACGMRADEHDADMIDYVNQLREGILEAYTGIVQGMKADGQGGTILPFADAIFGFLQLIAQDADRPEAVLRGAAGLIGDLADTLGGAVKQYLANDWIEALLKAARAGRGLSASTKEVGKWAKAMVKKAISS